MPLFNQGGHSAYGGCGLMTLPEPAPAEDCIQEYEGCVTETIVQGATYKREYVVSEGAASPVSIVTPGAAGAATIELATVKHCLEVGDCIRLYGHCNTIGCEDVNGYYTITDVTDELLTIAEEIPGVDPLVFTAPPSAPGCPNNTTVPLVVKMADLTGCELSGYVTNGLNTEQRPLSYRAVVSQGSNQVLVCPKGYAKCYDCISVDGTGIVNATVAEVQSAMDHDRLILADQVSQISSDCASAVIKDGVIALFRFDLTNLACGRFTVWIDTDTLDNTGQAVDPLLLDDIYVGTNDLYPCPGAEPLEEGDCAEYPLGYYVVALKCFDAAGVPETNVVAHGAINIEPTSLGVSC